MTRREILQQAGGLLGDQSAAFLTDVLNPLFDLVMLELGQRECLKTALQRSASFTLVADRRDYETREILQLQPPHYPSRIIELTAGVWGITDGAIEEWGHERFKRERLFDGDAKRGRPRGWRLWPNNRTLQVHPPCDADAAGTRVDVLYVAPPAMIGLDDDVTELLAEDIPTVVAGLRYHGATFEEITVSDRQINATAYEMAIRQMWGRAHNSKCDRVEEDESCNGWDEA